MTGIALCLCLTACGKSASPSSVSSLSNQLDSTANALTSISTVSPTDISVNKNDSLFEDSQLTQQTLLNEQYYKTEILNRTAILKNNLENVSLSKMQKAAINDLTSTLNKYTNSILNTKYEMNSSAKAISSMKKNASKNQEKLKAKYNRLACNSNMRSAYYENILNTLDEIENCLNFTCENCAPIQQQNNCDDCTPVEQEATTPKKTTSSALKKNIDTYQNADDVTDDTNQNSEQQFLPERQFRRRLYKNPNRYNNVYNRFERFNPSRNTDTYGPNRRNIDSFGGYGYNGYGNGGFGYGMNPYVNNGYGYGYGNNYYAGSNYGNRMTAPMPAAPATYANTEIEPEPRLETFEKKNEDNTIEKLSEKEVENNEKLAQQNVKNTTGAAIQTSLIKSSKDLKKELGDRVSAH